ncbi:MAG: mechanosensitive ion channel protein MscS [Bacteroidetes bacterium HGW-Bacteroidetes-15]|nr:MAG: mechanosensitive ion channel protein MscS [Bacteroidetes bacterium HGW-Bacteroidetes-15]
MDKSKFKGIRLRFLSVSVVVTLLILIAIQVVLYLQSKEIILLPPIISRAMSSITIISLTLFISTFILRISINRVYRIFEEPEEKIFYTKIYSWTVYSVAIFIILFHLGLSLGNITIFIGLIATGLAFAVRDVLLSFFGWIILLKKNPFRIGDYIRIGDDEGKVLHIGTFYVLLDKTEEFPEDFTRVPNRLFLEKSINILGRTTFHEKISFQLVEIPSTKIELIDLLKDEISMALNSKEHISISIDLRNEKLYIIVEYLVNHEQKQSIRSQVIDLTYSRFKEFIFIPRS